MVDYQNKINAMHNANELAEEISYQIKNNKIIITAPETLYKGEFKGQVNFYRPSDSNKDFKLKMKFNELGEMMIPIEKLSKGIYHLQLSWNINNKEYYKEKVINIK